MTRRGCPCDTKPGGKSLRVQVTRGLKSIGRVSAIGQNKNSKIRM